MPAPFVLIFALVALGGVALVIALLRGYAGTPPPSSPASSASASAAT